MQKPTRLFDCLEYQLKELPLPDMFAAKEGGRWKQYSTAEVNDLVNQLASGLLDLGISSNDMSSENRDKVAIISKNRPGMVNDRPRCTKDRGSACTSLSNY
jgi:long-chain acyl-CoA synthetase